MMKQNKLEDVCKLFSRQVFCWMDGWHGMDMNDIRQLEDQTKNELDEVCIITDS